MKTKIFNIISNFAMRSSNINHRVGWVLACLVLLFSLAVGNAMASGSTTYYTGVNVSVKTGAGTVYVNTASPATNGSSTTNSTAANKQNSGSTQDQPYYISAVPNTDYRFSGWELSGWQSSPSSSTATTNGTVRGGTSSGARKTATAQANFLQISIASVTPTSKTLNPTDARTSCTDYTGTVTFTTNNDNAASQIGTPAFSGQTGSGTWTASNSWAEGTSTVTYTFKGNGYYGGSGTSSGSRNNSATLTLPTAGGTSSKSVAFTANFPSLVLSAGSSDKVYPASPTTTANGSATFPVQYCDGAFDFTASISGASGGAWTKGDISVSITDAATGSGTVTVPFTFNAGGATGDFSATLTLTPVANTGGTAQSVTITAYSEQEAVNEASVTPAGGSATEYATFGEALDAANQISGSTLTLLKNIDLGTLAATKNVSKAMTIELNGKTLQANSTAAIALLTINKNVAVTIQDSKSGGMIYNTGEIDGVVYGVTVSKGTLNVTSGTIKAENTQQYFYGTSSVGGTATNKTGVGARGIQQAAATTVNISGSANIQAIASRNAFGIREESSNANTTTLNITGGTIYAEAPALAYGVYAYGKVNMSNGVVSTKLNTNLVNGNETWMSTTSASKWANNAVHREGHGIYMSTYARAAKTSCYYGTLTMTGGSISVVNENTTLVGTTIQSEPIYGVYFGASVYGVGAGKTATDGTMSQKASAIGSISNATITVNNSSQPSYGVMSYGYYNSADESEGLVNIDNSTVNVTSYQSAYGIFANVGINSDYGGCYAGRMMLENNNVTTTTTTGSISVALYATSTMTTIKTATSATYAGEYESSAYIYVKSGNYTATSETSYATAAIAGPWTTSNPQRGAFKTYFAVDGSLGGNKESMSGIYIQGGTFTANAKTTHARGVWNSGAVVIAGGAFNANATQTNAFGIYSNRGTVQATNATLTATAGTGTAYGVYSDAMINDYVGWKYAADNTLTNCNITAKTTTGNTAYGVYINGTTRTISSVNSSYTSIGDVVLGGYAVVGNASIKGCTITATSAGTTAGGIYRVNTQVSADKRDIAQGEFTAIGNTITATTTGGKTGYGIRCGGPSTIKDNDITVSTSAAESYGIIVGDGEHTISGNTVTAKGTGTVYGIQTYSAVNSTTGYKFQANATLEDNTVTATTTTGNTAYAIYATTADAVDVTTAGFEGTYVAAGGVVVNSGKYTATAAGTTAYAITLDATKTKNSVSNSATCTVNGGKFKGTATSTYADVNASAAVGNLVLAGGYYVNNTKLTDYAADGYAVTALTSGEIYNEGYRYQISDNSGAIVCKVYQGSTLKKSCQSLAEALQYTQQNSGTSYTIVMVENYVVPAGDYILPSNATLLVPYKDGQTSIDTHPTRVYAYTSPSVYRKLTFASGAHLDVLGKIQAAGRQAANGQTGGKNGCPHEQYGWIYLHEGSSITLENGSYLYAWGYVTGQGEIDAKRGSTVYEMFQVTDWRGGSATAYYFYGNDEDVFPLNQYYIQNIECPIKFRPGSVEKCDGTVNASSSARSFNDVKFIGLTNSGSFFEMDDEDMSEDTWVRKWYDAVNDKQVYEVNSSARMNSITLSLYGYTFSSSDYVLPVTNNMKIHLLTGSLQITQNTELLPGAEIEVDKEATAYIASGKTLYVFDISDWIAFTGTTHTYRLPYSPSWAVPTTCPRSATITADASLNLHGKFMVNGSLYTTAGGANIFSTNADAGTIQFATAASSSTKTIYVNNTTQQNSSGSTPKTCYPAWLQNDDGTHEETAGTAKDKSWIYYDSKWNCWEERDCFGYDAQNHPYAKPRAWVQLTSNEADANHLYHDAATGNRAFIVEDGCVWWEVEPTPYDGNKYKCVDPDYDGRYKYYEYVSNKWQEAKVTITWMNGSTTLATYSNALYGVRPTYLSANPYKAATSTEYYTWLGWNKGSTDGEFFAKDAELPIANENTTYYAKFETHKYQYTVTFKNSAADGGQVIDAPLVTAGEIPVCGKTPTKTATEGEIFTFSHWSGYAPDADLPVVTGTAEYTAVYTATPRPYTIIFQNYDGTVLQESDVNYGTEPTYDGATPYRAKDAFYSYTFSGWSPAIANVTGDATYTAQYNSTTRGYTIQFLNYDGTVLETKDVPRDQTPEYTGPAFSKPSDETFYYVFNGWSPTLEDVTEDASYTAQFIAVPKDFGPELDIIDWTWNGTDGGTLKLNLNGIPAAGWPYEVNETTYYKDEDEASKHSSTKYRAADRTLTIPYSGDEDRTLYIVVNSGSTVYSCRPYRIPHINNISEVDNEGHSIIFVNSGTVTVSENTTVNAVYVAPGAELVVNSGVTLTVNNIMLRTTPWEAAILDNQGTIAVKDQAYYTRIIADNSKYYQFAIPLSVRSTDDVILSNHTACPYGKTWLLKSYSESSRAANGTGPGISNWVEVADKSSIAASVGYELYSGSAYYREFYFPVDLSTAGDRVSVSHTDNGAAGSAHAGWNALCSPLLGRASHGSIAPWDRLKVSFLRESGVYEQDNPETINPAVPFYYQASETQTVVFTTSAFSAPSREWNATIPAQWLHLTINNQAGDVLDKTSVFVHPEKFTPEYESGYDVTKQSLEGGKALLYSELPCGKLAFAAVPDSLAETRIPLTAYAATEGEYVFSMVENDYLGRLQYVFLHDTQTGLVVDLLERDCAVNLAQGTNAGRFYIQCVFAAAAPEISTGVNHLDTDNNKAQKIIYNDKVYIIYQGRVYDMTGRQCELK